MTNATLTCADGHNWHPTIIIGYYQCSRCTALGACTTCVSRVRGSATITGTCQAHLPLTSSQAQHREEVFEGSRQERQAEEACQRQIGNATITLSDDHFINGYQAGHLQYLLGYRARLLSDEDIYHFLATNLLAAFHSNRWNAGYVVGWLLTLYEKGNVPRALSQREAAERQVQP